MSLFNRFCTQSLLFSCLLLSLTACANSPLGQAVERSLEADPILQENPAASPDSETVSPSPEPISAAIELPEDFPVELPQYPNAELRDVSPTDEIISNPDIDRQTRWATADRASEVRQFYQTQLPDGWEITSPTGANPMQAKRDDLQVTIEILTGEPAASPAANGQGDSGTEFIIAYRRGETATTSPTPTPAATTSTPSTPTAATPSAPIVASSSPLNFSDLNQAPEELRRYVEDLAQLGVLPLATGNSGAETAFKPNQAITRREYARWLVTTNNRFFSDRPAHKIRLGVTTSQSAFQDVPRTDPDFAVIQGLAEAGIVPSSLAGDATVVTFRPDAPLTREDLLLWKIPLDTRQVLPNATVDAVKQAWGFQDASRIDPKALRAVLADYQNGDLSNIRRAFGFTTLFQPKKAVTRAEAAATLWYFGAQGDGISAEDVLRPQPAQ